MFIDFISCWKNIVKNFPNNIAIVEYGKTKISYSKLYKEVEIFSYNLSKLNTNSSKLIGICLDKSIAYIKSMLGLWFSKIAFLPIDPNLPKQRLDFIVKDSKLDFVISSRKYSKLFKKLDIQVLYYEDLIKETKLGKLEDPKFTKNTLAYVIYTSGSTGTPKGVMVTHQGIVNFLQAQIPVFKLTPSSRSLFYLSTSFDASISDVGTALLSGAAIYIEKAENLKDIQNFNELLNINKITHIDIPPSLLRIMDAHNIPMSLETIIVGGEVCPIETVKLWAAKLNLVNVYGPTETTVCSSLSVCNSNNWDYPFIGEPIANTTFYLLDESLKPVLRNTPAELYIGGIGLALGYLNREKLTAEKFIVLNSERLYKTGDLVKEHSDGRIEFLGRVDRQVKIRGQLVELEEIEARLLQYPNIQLASVVKRPLSPKNNKQEMLVAFIVLNNNYKLDKNQLLSYLSFWLPSWMVPQRIEIIDSLPTTNTGKVDLQKLISCPLEKTVEINIVRDKKAYSKEATLLKEIWERELNIPEINLEDNLFELGANSLNIIRVSSILESKGLKISPTALMKSSNILESLDSLNHGLTNIRNNPTKKLNNISNNKINCKWLSQDIKKDKSFSKILRKTKINNLRETGDKDIFLTGATGFLGSRLLIELLSRSNKKVYCLVRDTDIVTAKEKILEKLANYKLTLSQSHKERIKVILGDLDKDYFGLPFLDYQDLAKKISIVFHCAAWVNMLLPYKTLKTTNVKGTMKVLQFCRTQQLKKLHYASTLSVFVSTDKNSGKLSETNKLAQNNCIYGGYGQSKWASEYLLELANKSFTRKHIYFYRFGLLTGDTTFGYTPSTDFFSLFIKGINELGVIPNKSVTELLIDITPIDYAAKAMAIIGLEENIKKTNQVFHIANPKSLSFTKLLKLLNSFGLLVKKVSLKKWNKNFSLNNNNISTAKASVYLVLCRLMKGTFYKQNRALDLFQATGVKFSTKNTKNVLKMYNLKCPKPTKTLLYKYFMHILQNQEEI